MKSTWMQVSEAHQSFQRISGVRHQLPVEGTGKSYTSNALSTRCIISITLFYLMLQISAYASNLTRRLYCAFRINFLTMSLSHATSKTTPVADAALRQPNNVLCVMGILSIMELSPCDVSKDCHSKLANCICEVNLLHLKNVIQLLIYHGVQN